MRADPDSALEYSRIAEAIGDPEDVDTQVPWRSARAKVLASRGASDEARMLAMDAVRLAANTKLIRMHAEALVDLAEVHEIIGDIESSGPPLREALRLFELKGDLVSSEAIRARLEPVTSP
jgi:hypothetical protein